MNKILVTGAGGQLGTELVSELRTVFGFDSVIASDIKSKEETGIDGPFIQLDIRNFDQLKSLVEEKRITQIYHLAAILSAKGEDNPLTSWDINMKSLLNVLEVARLDSVEKVFWPSSIAVFGPDTQKDKTPQVTLTNPVTVYGISKLAGERWCEYYHNRFGVDVRSLRYPGLIGYGALPGGGTTDYAVDIYHKAIEGSDFECFLSEDATLPMMYMRDAVKATIQLMEANSKELSVRSSYNIAAMSFSPQQIYEEIRLHFPDFRIEYKPDDRQKIAEGWPRSIDDNMAKSDWNWSPQFDLSLMTLDMIKNIRLQKEKI